MHQSRFKIHRLGLYLNTRRCCTFDVCLRLWNYTSLPQIIFNSFRTLCYDYILVFNLPKKKNSTTGILNRQFLFTFHRS